jgi:hypothetical protein
MSHETQIHRDPSPEKAWLALSLCFMIVAWAPTSSFSKNSAGLHLRAVQTPTATPCPSPAGPLSTPVPC